MPPGDICGLTVAEYAKAKHLDPVFLNELGLRDAFWCGKAAVRIPYLDAVGRELAVRFRIALTGDRFRWQTSATPLPYGLHRLHVARSSGHVILVEGESDCHSAWLHNVPALGIPGATSWKPRWSQLLAGVTDLYVIVEPDTGGETFVKKLAVSLGPRLRLINDLNAKDLSALHITDARNFVERLNAALSRSQPCRSRALESEDAPAAGRVHAGVHRSAWRDGYGHVHLPPIEVTL